MKILNKYSVFTALASTKYVNCRESGLRDGAKLSVMQDSFVTNGIERNVENSQAENIEIGPQGLGGALDKLLEAWNKERSVIGLDNLELSVLANQLAKNMADQGKIDPSYADTCYGYGGYMAGNSNSVDSLIENWVNSDNGAIITDDRIRFTGIGIARKSSSEIYAVEIFCSYDFVNKLELIGTGDAIRESMLSDIKNERHKMGMDQITERDDFQMLAQTWARQAALNNEVVSHNQKYRQECQGAGGEAGASGHSSDIQSLLQKDAIEGYLANDNVRYVGIGIAVRNDGAAFSVQLFCSFTKGAGPDPGQETWAEKIANFIISKENVLRGEVVEYTTENNLKTSPITTIFAQEWANKLEDSATISEDPDRGRGCGAYDFQIVAKGSNRAEIWDNIVNNKGKVQRLESFKTKFVGTGVVKNSDGEIILVQNFCTWKPVDVISME